MLQELTTTVRRWAGLPVEKHPLVRVGQTTDDALSQAHSDLGSLRGVTPSAADQTPCVCPEPCERDHANE